MHKTKLILDVNYGSLIQKKQLSENVVIGLLRNITSHYFCLEICTLFVCLEKNLTGHTKTLHIYNIFGILKNLIYRHLLILTVFYWFLEVIINILYLLINNV